MALLHQVLKDEGAMPTEILDQVNLDVWAQGKVRRAEYALPVTVVLKQTDHGPRVKPSPLKPEAKTGIALILKHFSKRDAFGLASHPVTPFLAVKKPGTGEYRFVHGLRAVNEVVQDVHSTVRNPWTPLANLPEIVSH